MRIIPFLHIKNPTFSNSLQVQIGRVWSEWQDLNLRPLPPQAIRCSFLRDIASNTCFLVRKDCCKIRCVLLSPRSPVLKVVKYVVVKSAPIWCGQTSRERITFYRAIVVRSCGRFLEGFTCLGVLYCNSYESVCQEVSRMNFWDAVIKEKGFEKEVPFCDSMQMHNITKWKL